MQTEEYAALGGLITIIAAALALIIKQVEQSRCTRIKCCGIEMAVGRHGLRYGRGHQHLDAWTMHSCVRGAVTMHERAA